MTIVFFCQSCGARFDVGAGQAGKRGRCKKCGQMMVVPRASELASMAALPAVAVGAGAAAAAVDAPSSWIGAVTSNVALKPISVDGLPFARRVLGKKPDPLDDADDSKPYALGQVIQPKVHIKLGGKAAGPLTTSWRRVLGVAQRILRWLNETAYFVSVPFLMLLLIGVVLSNRPLAVLGATAVVLLNIGRLVAGVANLVVIPFREGIAQGVAFLIPPFTFFYLNNHWKKMRKPTRRVVEPVLTIGLVVLAFTFIPWLSAGGSKSGPLRGRIRAGAGSLEREIRGQVGRAKAVDVENLGEEAVGRLRQLGQDAGKAALGGK